MSRDHIPGIGRIDDDRTRTHAWVVHLRRRRKSFIRCFSDGVHGGKELAYQAAVEYLRCVEKNQPGLLRNEVANILRKNNRSGVPGVCKYKSGRHEYWIASWPTTLGKSKRAKFSVAKYGEEKAFELAAAARKRALEQLEEPYIHQITKSRATTLRPTVADTLPQPDLRIKRVRVQRLQRRVTFYDGRAITVPLSWFPVLRDAEPEARQQWALHESGEAVVWQTLGLSITAEELLKLA